MMELITWILGVGGTLLTGWGMWLKSENKYLKERNKHLENDKKELLQALKSRLPYRRY